jgi:FkbM family methyltransferase
MGMTNVVKRWMTVLPEPLQAALIRGHFLRIVRGISEVSERDFSLIAHLVVRDDHVMDVGANIGAHSKFLSGLVGPGGRVYAVEPSPRNLSILAYVKRRLALDNVQIVPCAASDADGRASLVVPVYASGGENYYRPHLGSKEGLRSVEVETRRIDSLLKDRERRISFIKIDVEGHELPCVRGAVETLKRDRPALLVEVTTDPENPASPAATLFRLLADLAYRPYVWEGAKVRARVCSDWVLDHFFLAAEHVAILQTRGLLIESP